MAQKTEKEDTEFKVVPETITQCNNCGVIGNPVSNKMCPKCVASTSVSSAAGAIKFGEKSPKSRSSPEKTTDRKESSRDLKRGCSVLGIDDDDDEVREHESSVHVQLPAKKREVNRCSGCRRKVGLTGFRCRCGELFCGEHRYSDRHDCNYDYKAAGRESIAKENPVFKAPKIRKL